MDGSNAQPENGNVAEAAPVPAGNQVDWERKYKESSAEARRIAAERDTYAAALQQAQRPAIPQRARPDDQLREMGVDPGPIREMLQEQIAEAFAPLTRAMSARQEVVARYPDYSKFESDVARFIQEDPARLERYNRMFAADPAGAIEYGILSFSAERQRSAPSPHEPLEEKAHAQIPGQRSADASRRGPSQAQARDDAWQRYQQDPSRANASNLAGIVIRSDPTFQRLVSEGE